MNWKKWIELAWWVNDFAARDFMSRSSRESLEAAQQKQFRRLVRHVWKHSRYYRSLMSARRLDPETCVVGDFPEMTKQDLLDHFDDIVTDPKITFNVVRRFNEQNNDASALLCDRYYVVRTTGSSNQVGFVVYTAREWIRGCSHTLRFAPGTRLRKRSAWIGCDGHYTGATAAMTGRRGINRLFFDCRMFDINCRLTDIVAGLNAFQPQLLSGYAAALNLIAREQAEGRLRLAPRRIVNSGEPLPAELRRFLECSFEAPVSNLYSATETLFMGAAVNSDDGMCLFEDDLIFEIFDDHICVTNLFNRTTPLIRYRLNDALILQENPVPGSPFRRVKEIVGRSERMLLFRNDRGQREFLHPFAFLALDVPDVPFFQLRILDEAEFIFRIQLRAGLSAAGRREAVEGARKRVLAVLSAKHLDQSVSFRIEIVDSLVAERQRGKFNVIEFDNETPAGEVSAA